MSPISETIFLPQYPRALARACVLRCLICETLQAARDRCHVPVEFAVSCSCVVKIEGP